MARGGIRRKLRRLGDGRLEAWVKDTRKGLTIDSRLQMRREAEATLDLAREKTPYGEDLGPKHLALEKRGFSHIRDEIQLKMKETTRSLGFELYVDSPYAIWLHEHPRAGRTGGVSPSGRSYRYYSRVGGPGFIREAIREAAPRVRANIRKTMSRSLKRHKARLATIIKKV